MKNIWTIVLAVTQLCMGLLLLAFLHKPEASMQAYSASSTVSPNSTTSINAAAPSHIMTPEFEEKLRTIIRSEFIALNHSTNAVAVAPHRELNLQELQQHNAANEESTNIVSSAISRGVWTAADRDAVRQHLQFLSEEEHIELTKLLYGAINRQELKPEDNSLL
jgi:hypothetical protein